MPIFIYPTLTSVSGFLLIISCFLFACQTEKETHASAYEQFLSQAYARGQFNGNALILKEGEIIYQGAFGLSNIDPIDSLSLNSVFRLGSVSKQFTAMGIMILKEKGQLSYDQDIRDILPELPYQGITIRHLLHHMSGLPDYYAHMMEAWYPDLTVDDPDKFISGNEDIIRFLADKTPAVRFQPGEQWEYSNTGYVLLASIITRISGMPFEQYLNEQIFEPANMSNTVVYSYKIGPDPLMPNRVFGFRLGMNGTDLISHDAHFLNAAQGDGGIYSTLEDLVKWDRILYTDALISSSTREEAFTPGILNDGDTSRYGFGWFIDSSLSGKKVVAHTGGWVGFVTYILREIEEDNCIIILTNNSGRYFGPVMQGLTNILHHEPYAIPRLSIAEAIGKVIMNEGAEAAVVAYKHLKSEQADEYWFGEGELNSLGYQLLATDHAEEAVAIFRLNTEEFPTSANVFDSYGDGLLARGDTVNALLQFKQCLLLDSTIIATKEKIRQIERGDRP